MATITSSSIVWANPQIDGRSAVREVHTDDSGVDHILDYLADAGADLDAHLAARAVDLAASLTQKQSDDEIFFNLQAVIAMGSVATPTFNHSTLQQNAQALMGLYNQSSGAAVIMIGDYLNAQTDDTLTAGSGLPKDEIDSFRPVWTDNATVATMIRAAAVP